ncbi:lipid-A-disaccharide synthase [Candidatus Laterigemmans baculatus]|uniref:lipid-A-disaccharide synthase n=1 Tax=Candidatus Laterigemmans baculatus TaxID=2770505 RepID=UPI0013DCDBD5|nr:lipid-A-disaccharide synthase [Candidatus Laterigemmans baculatus]
MTKTIFFSAGEPSGDQHTARLIEALADRHPKFRFRGFGGPEMRRAGCKLDYELTQMAVMGIVEVLPQLRKFFSIADLATDAFASGQVDAVVLVDFPGFNWHIAKRAKKFGIPVYYYLPPQLWAWGRWRIRKMRRYVDHVLSVLPFEHQWYSDQGLNTQFVGHPFFDAVAERPLDPTVLRRFEEHRSRGRRLVAVLPGSRQHEVHRNWPVMLEAIRRLAAQHRDVHFLVAAFRDSHCLWCRDQMNPADASLPIDFFVGKTSEAIEAAECAMMVSGSVSLELMARNTPAAVIYRAGRVLYATGRALVRVPSITLPNLIAGKTVFPEFASVGNPEPAVRFLRDSVGRMLTDHSYRQQLGTQLQELRLRYGRPGATGRTADVLSQSLGILPTACGEAANCETERAAA